MSELKLIKCPCPVCQDGYKDDEGLCKITHLIKSELVACIDGYTMSGGKSSKMELMKDKMGLSEKR